MSPFWISLIYVFVAEMGDKTQLVALAFATKYKTWTVLAGVFLATFVVHLISVVIGGAVSHALPVYWIKIIAGLSFIFFGLWTLRGDSLDEDEVEGAKSRFGPLLTVAVAFFLAELGDKTMLATITVASEQQDFYGVWIGSTIGMVLADALAIVVGKLMGKSLPDILIKYVGAAVFLISGFWTLWEAIF
ncbi:MAG TPA: TMEM165/GDT1 family protein [Pyrinomonadaceae bacterium]|jgi:putative Ca2+/H+ antiporter (TMEM165/GDT1 family)